MKPKEAVELRRAAVAGRSGAWADMGAGSGTFTRALLELLAPGSRVLAVDRDASALRSMRAVPGVTVVMADFAASLAISEPLDGMLFANSLHFVEDARAVLTRLAESLRTGGRVVVIEYDGRGPSRWVPYPLASARWPELAEAAHLRDPVVRARRRSAFGGDLYLATADRA
jgi:trans-aconitate methyltransferase